jgi:hypothetical protein
LFTSGLSNLITIKIDPLPTEQCSVLSLKMAAMKGITNNVFSAEKVVKNY